MTTATPTPLDPAQIGQPTHLSRARAIIKDNVQYPISPVVPVVTTIPEGAPEGTMVIFKKEDETQGWAYFLLKIGETSIDDATLPISYGGWLELGSRTWGI